MSLQKKKKKPTKREREAAAKRAYKKQKPAIIAYQKKHYVKIATLVRKPVHAEILYQKARMGTGTTYADWIRGAVEALSVMPYIPRQILEDARNERDLEHKMPEDYGYIEK